MPEAFALVVPVAIVLLVAVLLWAIPVRLWIEAKAAAVPVGFGTRIGMRLRTVPPAAIVRPLINATKAGVDLGIDQLEAHYLAGGHVDRVVRALSSADKAGIDLAF
jgi:uncharacterized protein YqfA (UPF0365 family)